jgi:hypothetical protein
VEQEGGSGRELFILQAGRRPFLTVANHFRMVDVYLAPVGKQFVVVGKQFALVREEFAVVRAQFAVVGEEF